MPAVVRLGDMSTKDPCGAPPRATAQGASKTFANGLPIHCVGHKWQPHSCPSSPPHTTATAVGSAKTFIEGRPIARVGDLITCGSTCAQGSPDTMAN